MASIGQGNDSRPSFAMKSHANLSIYRVSEASNESPDKMSSNNMLEDDYPKDDQTSLSKRSGFSASFYFHANKLSNWKASTYQHEEMRTTKEEYSQTQT